MKVNETNSNDGRVVITSNVDGEINDVTTLVNSLKANIVSVESNSKTYSGFVIEKENDVVYIISSYNASENPTVIFDSGVRLQGSVVGKDEATGLCVIQVEVYFEVEGMNLAENNTSIGENIVAISGRSMENGNMILSMGFSSDLGLYELSENSSYVSSAYISDMNISSSQIGSAVVNLAGELIGMVSNDDEDHMTYIVSSTEIKKVYDEIKNNESVSRGILDITIRPINEMESYEKNENNFDLDVTEGVFVSEVGSNSCAYGILKHGDRIIEIDEKEINSYEDFMNIQYKHNSGDVVEVVFDNDGVQRSEKVTLK